MRYPKVTDSRDGVKRMNITIIHRIGAFELATALGQLIDEDPSIDFFNRPFSFYHKYILDNYSREKIYFKLRDLLYQHGVSMWCYRESWIMQKSVEEFADKNIFFFFPELSNKKTEKRIPKEEKRTLNVPLGSSSSSVKRKNEIEDRIIDHIDE